MKEIVGCHRLKKLLGTEVWSELTSLNIPSPPTTMIPSTPWNISFRAHSPACPAYRVTVTCSRGERGGTNSERAFVSKECIRVSSFMRARHVGARVSMRRWTYVQLDTRGGKQPAATFKQLHPLPFPPDRVNKHSKLLWPPFSEHGQPRLHLLVEDVEHVDIGAGHHVPTRGVLGSACCSTAQIRPRQDTRGQHIPLMTVSTTLDGNRGNSRAGLWAAAEDRGSNRADRASSSERGVCDERKAKVEVSAFFVRYGLVLPFCHGIHGVFGHRDAFWVKLGHSKHHLRRRRG